MPTISTDFETQEISTIFVYGFPDDMREREFTNMFTFCKGFESALLKIPAINEADESKKQIIGFAKFLTRGDAIEAREVLSRKRVGEADWSLKAEIAKKNLKVSTSLSSAGKRVGGDVESPTTILASFRVRSLGSAGGSVGPTSPSAFSNSVFAIPSSFQQVPSTDSILSQPEHNGASTDLFYLTSPQLPRDLLNPPDYPGFDKGRIIQHSHHDFVDNDLMVGTSSSVESADSLGSNSANGSSNMHGSSDDSSNDDIVVGSGGASSAAIPTRSLLSREMPAASGGIFTGSFFGESGGRGGDPGIMSSRFVSSMETPGFLGYRDNNGPNSAGSIETSFSSSLGGSGGAGSGLNNLFGPDFNNGSSVMNSLMSGNAGHNGAAFFDDRSRTPPSNTTSGLLSPPVTPINNGGFRGGNIGGQPLASVTGGHHGHHQQQHHPITPASSKVSMLSSSSQNHHHIHHQQSAQNTLPVSKNVQQVAPTAQQQQSFPISTAASVERIHHPSTTSQEHYYAQLQQQLQTKHASNNVQVSTASASSASSLQQGHGNTFNGGGLGGVGVQSGSVLQQPPFSNPNLQARDQNPPCNTLYVGNLPSSTNPEELEVLFSHCRGYKRLCFRMRSNGPMCFVEFEDVMCASVAMQELYGHSLTTHTKGGGIRLSFSKNPLGVRLVNGVSGGGGSTTGISARFGY